MFLPINHSPFLSIYLSITSYSYLSPYLSFRIPVYHLFLSTYLDIHINILLLIIFTNPSAQVGYDTRSIFKQSLTGLNSELSFSLTSCLTKAEEPSLPYYLPILLLIYLFIYLFLCTTEMYLYSLAYQYMIIHTCIYVLLFLPTYKQLKLIFITT